MDQPAKIKVVDPDTGFVRSVIDPAYRNKENVVMVRISGKEHPVTFDERNRQAVRLAQSVKGLDMGDVDLVTSIVGVGTRWFVGVNTTATARMTRGPRSPSS